MQDLFYMTNKSKHKFCIIKYFVENKFGRFREGTKSTKLFGYQKFASLQYNINYNIMKLINYLFSMLIILFKL